MDQTISAAAANREFSKVVRHVRDGESYVVTSHGTPVARIVPFRAADEGQMAARAALRHRLERQAATDAGRWTRDELYER